MHNCLDVKYLVPSMIIFHQPREHYYVLLHRTMIKCDKESGKSWEYGWSYQEVEKTDSGFQPIPNSLVYSRPDSLFDSDWTLIG